MTKQVQQNGITERKVVFAAMSKRNFYMREHIIRFVLQKGYTPTCAFMMYSYFLLDTVDRKSLIAANNDLIRRSDELWVFGEISDGVKEEIILAEKLDMPIRYFASSLLMNKFHKVNKSKVQVERKDS